MVVYWDFVMLFNFLTDYLLLYSAMRLAGRDIGRKRLALGALLGALYAVVQLLFPRSFFLMALVFLVIGALAFYGSGRAIKLTLLFLILSCAFGGAVLLLSQLGNAERVTRGAIYAELPWGVFLAAAGISYIIFCVAFRGSAEQNKGQLAQATIVCGEKSITLRLLHDTGNTLRDELTGVGVPVISANAMKPLLQGQERFLSDSISYHSIAQADGVLPTIVCDRFLYNGQETEIHRIALSDNEFGDSFVGILPQEIERGRENAQKALAEA